MTSPAGNPTAVKTITMVISPALGTPAAPILATVAVILKQRDTILHISGPKWQQEETIATEIYTVCKRTGAYKNTKDTISAQ